MMMRGRINEARHGRNGSLLLGGYSDVDRAARTGSNLRPTLPYLYADLRPVQRDRLWGTRRWLLVGSWHKVAQHNVWLTPILSKGGNRSTDVRAIRLDLLTRDRGRRYEG